MLKSLKRHHALIQGLSATPVAAAILSVLLSPAYAAPLASLTRHTRDAVLNHQAVLSAPLSPSRSLRLNIALPLRNQLALSSFLQQLYDPQSPSYRQFLTVQEFTDRFGPTQSDYDAVIAFAGAHGLTVTGTAPNRMLVDVEGPVSNVESAFHLSMNVYQHPTENRTFFAPDREPSADLPFPLWHITGLDNFSIPQPASLTQKAGVVPNATGSGPGGQFIGSDFRAAYYGGTALTGAGQAVGLLEYAGYNIKDVTNYFAKVNQPLNVPVNGVSTDGSSLNCSGSCDDTEQVLDIEVAISMAPALSQLLVYVSDNSDVAMLNRMATDNIAKSLSSSWAWSPADPASDDPIFQEFLAQGQTFFTASGDSGSWSRRTRFVYPADDAYVTAVGGTDLVTNGAGGSWKSETAWSDSGGGISTNNIAIPKYQQIPGVITAANHGSTTLRNAPDVAAEANYDNYICYDGICGGGWGGTSFAAPRWAGFVALANELSVIKGVSPVGFMNPLVYATGVSSFYTKAFHDITAGSNGGFTAVPGFDLVTGWGSPNGNFTLALLAR